MPRGRSWIREGRVRRRALPAHRRKRGGPPVGILVRSTAVIATVAGGLLFGMGAMADTVGRAASEAPPLQFAAGSADFEAELWTFIKDGESPDDIEAFLAIFPDGKYAGLAKDKLARLRGGKSAPAIAPAKPKPALPSLRIKPIRVTPMQARRAARTKARVRARPDTSSATITVIPQGQVLDVTGKVEKSDWVRAELPGGRRGYIYGPLLGPVPVAKPAPRRQPEPMPPAQPETPAPEVPKSASVTPAPSAAPDVAAQRAEISARWDQKIGLVKRSGQYAECYSAGGSIDTDSTEYMDCTDREAAIAQLEAAKQAELAGLPKTESPR